MRKMTVRYMGTIFEKLLDADIKSFFENVESFEMLEMIRLDVAKGIKVTILEIRMRKGHDISELRWPDFIHLTVLDRSGDRYIVLADSRVPDGEAKDMFKDLRIDVIWTTPTCWKDGFFVVSCMGEEEELAKALDMLKMMGGIESVSYSKGVYQEHRVLSVLTDKQKDILLEAKRSGYYRYPRKVNAEDLAGKLGLTKATVVEHLRKAEIRLMDAILEGHA